MYLPDFEYYAPESIEEACNLLAVFGTRAKVLAGGTDLLHKMKHEQLSPEIIISLKKLEELVMIKYDKGRGLIIGSRATQNEIANSHLIKEKYSSISEAAHNMANNQIRHIGTVGGNIVNAVPSADLPPILIALGASVKLVNSKRERIILLQDFFAGVHESVIEPEELLTEIVIPDQALTGSSYIRFGLRRSGALAVVGVAAAVTMEGDICKDARIVLGAAAPIPMRAIQAEELLKGQPISNELLEEVGICASREAKPRSSIRGSEEYRRDLIRIHTRRALQKAINEGHV